MRLLDTDVCIELLRGNPLVVERRAATSDRVGTTWMTAAELYYGAEKSAAPHHNRQLVARLLGTLPLVRPRGRAARRFGALKASLEGLGQRLADADLIIASLCLAHDAVLVTGNLSHYRRVPGLLTEDWIRGD